MSASEAHVLTGDRPFAGHYVHAGMVGLDGEKMSKSKGNLVFVSALRREGHDPMAVRLALLGHHYRRDWGWTEADLLRAEERLGRWRAAAAAPAGPPGDDVVAGLRRALAEDLDAPGALEVVDRWVDAGTSHQGHVAGAPALVSHAVDALLGVRL
jgi:L-cysteine:1D-myo-inositol 2-amino-2-deoxy-alpha-D-glucopyranoside ligase